MTTESERYQNRLWHLLVANGIVASDSDLPGAITAFQEKEGGLLADGVAGPQTLWVLQQVLLEVQLPLTRLDVRPPPAVETERTINLRADVALAYRKLQKDLEDLGGSMTSAGGVRRLSSGANANRSSLSHHYWGGAFDLAMPSGFFNPRRDPFVIERTSPRTWRVWARAEGAEKRTVTATYWDNWTAGRDKTMEVTDNLADFTDLAAVHGFKPIGPRSTFTRDRNRLYGGAEWWHFQYEQGLFPGISQIGIEILRMSHVSETAYKRANKGLWDSRRTVFHQGWR